MVRISKTLNTIGHLVSKKVLDGTEAMSLITHSFADPKPYPWYLVQYEPDEHKCIRQIAPKELLVWNMEVSFYDSIRKQSRSAKEHVIIYNTNGDSCCTYIAQYARSFDEVIIQQNILHMFFVRQCGKVYNVTESNIRELGDWVLLSYFADFTKKDFVGPYTGICYGIYHRSRILFILDQLTGITELAIRDLDYLHKVHILQFSNKFDDLVDYIKILRNINLISIQLIDQSILEFCY